MTEDIFSVCNTSAEFCDLTVTCWNHLSHHEDRPNLRYITRGSPAKFACPDFSTFPDEDGFITLYASQGALS